MNAQTKTITRPWLALFGISLASFLGCIDFTIVNTALPSIQAELNASVTQLQWVINIFMLALSALMVVAGRFADLHGRRKWLFIGMALFGISSMGAGLAPSIHWLITFRFLQGMAVAILYTVPVAIITNIFPENIRGRATGILIGVNGLGLAIGPVIGGFILSAFSWRYIFFVNVPLIIISFIICATNLIESKNTEHGAKVDWFGLVLLLIGMPLIIFATVNGSVWGWASLKTIGTYAVALMSLILFYFIEQRSDSPIIRFSLFANHKFFGAILANFALAFFYTVAFFLMPLYLHNIHFDTAWKIGLMLLPATAMVALLSPVVGHFVDKSGPKIALMIGFSLFILSALMQAYFTASTSTLYIISAFLFFGIGWAFILSPSIVAAISAVPESISGVAMGSLGTLHNFGGAIGLAIGTVVYHYRAKLIALADLAKQNVAPGAWVDKAIADPDNAVLIITHNANIATTKATAIFQNFFISGYNSAMLLLMIVSMVALAIVIFGIKSE